LRTAWWEKLYIDLFSSTQDFPFEQQALQTRPIVALNIEDTIEKDCGFLIGFALSSQNIHRSQP
jgi:hypothetical protein